jgi:hypothetical protein
VHGKLMPMEELKPCDACDELHGVSRLLCINCRDDRPRARPNFGQCVTGYCPATEVNSHGEGWGQGWRNTAAWAAHEEYDPARYSVPQRIGEFLDWHPDPQETMDVYARACQDARIGRDLTGEEPALVYGAGRGARGQLANLDAF